MRKQEKPSKNNQHNGTAVRKLIIYTTSGRINMTLRERKPKEEMLQKGFRAKGIYSISDGKIFPVEAEFRPLTGIERRYLDDNPTWQNLAYCFYGSDGRLIDVKIENIHFI